MLLRPRQAVAGRSVPRRHRNSPAAGASPLLPSHPPCAECDTRAFCAAQVKVYELSQLALKFERHLLSEVSCAALLRPRAFPHTKLTPLCAAGQIIDFQILSEDYSKMVFACVDRSLVFHARFGGYLSMRLPKMPRSVTYHAPSADVIAVGSSSDVYRYGCSERAWQLSG